MDDPAPQPIFLKDHRPPAFLIDTVHLDVVLEPAAATVTARLAVRRNLEAAEPGARLVLDGEKLELREVAIDGRPLSPEAWQLTDATLTIAELPSGPFELQITTVCNPEANKALSGLYRSGAIYCTQCEPEGFRRITYFLDRPDVLAVYTTRIEAAKADAPVLLANGNPVEAGDIAGTDRHYAVWHDPHPKPSYLFALVGGDLACVRDNFTTASGASVDLRIYVEQGKQDRCDWAMESLKRAMRWDEERFGREYDLDVFMIVAVSDFNMGAMENKGLNVFNDKLILARPDTATDGDYAAIEAVIAHEYFHNWSGNRVTCRDWFQLCLKEGLTVFRDQEFTGDMRSAGVKRINDVRMLKTHQFPEDGGPLAHPVRPDSYIEINNFYTATVYEKGAELCRMIQTMVGRDGFRTGLDLYFERHDGEAATVEDFIAAMSDANDADLSQFMTWYNQAGTPELACSLSYDAAARLAEISVAQVTPPTPGQPKKEPLHIPLKLGLLSQNGDDLPLRLEGGAQMDDGLLHVREREQVFRFTDVPSRPVPSLLRSFSAPVKLTVNLEDETFEFLMAHDRDAFNRWQAGQSYATSVLIDMVGAIRGGETPSDGLAFARALGATLGDDALDPAYRAEFLKLPSESDIAREIGEEVDPDAIHAAGRRLRATVGGELHGDLGRLYETSAPPEPYSPDAGSAGLRALRNVSMGLMAATRQDEDVERVARHYESATNMTDKMAALSVLTHIGGTTCETAFHDFFETWRDDHLVIDKWFALQAVAAEPETVDRVRELLTHPLFSLKTPNKVRALIGAFANLNPVAFNRSDGAGYELVAKAGLEIDRFNPQIAARLFGAFKSWRMLEAGRQSRARATLERIAGQEGLSRDTFEIVSKTLGASG
ncbi:MAG: aminopeptidase N [Methyloligellaceae bacterium]